MLRLMLDYHPDVAFLSEFEYAVEQIPPESDWPELPEYYQFLAIHRIFQSHEFSINRSLSYIELVDDFLRQKQDRDKKRLVGATLHRKFDQIPRVWPGARFIHIVRDGRDVAQSCIRMGWAGNVWFGSQRWIDAEQLWDRFQAMIPADRYVEVKYETLVESPKEELNRICQFLGVGFDNAMLNYHEATTYDAPDLNLIYQWKHKQSDFEIRQAEARLGDRLAQRGYESSGLPPLRVTGLLKAYLHLQDKMARLRFRMRRHGPWLFATEWVLRRLRLESLWRRVRRKMNVTVETASK